MFSSLSWQLPVSDLLQKFDLPARWKTFLLEQFHDAIEDLRVTWPDLQSLEVHFRDIENFDPEFAQDIIDNPDDHIEASIRVLREVLIEAGAKGMNPFVRLVGFPKDMHRTVRQLRADDIGKMLSIEGLVSKITSVRPRIYRASFMCESCGPGHQIIIEQPNEQELIEPMECSLSDGGCGKAKRDTRFHLLTRDSEMINNQFIEIQEAPEGLRGGAQPQRIGSIAEHDLAGMLNPGDRVTFNGTLFVRSQRKGGKNTPIFDIFLKIHSIERQNTPLEEIVIGEEDEQLIRNLASREDVYQLLCRSIAPSIFGLHQEKESLMLQLFGGVSRKNADGTRSRGDIHILLMGDPGVAKSQLLSYMSKISPRGQFASGMSASAAGLTAAAVQDSMSDGRWTLEAGALALADLGIAAIDEFDKMNDNDRSSMHEAMEQQRISVSKAGINATLRTRCAVLAAANPKSGKFEALTEQPFVRQVNLGPPLLSRFDIIWLLTDTPSVDHDTMIANHIVDTRVKGVSELQIEEGSVSDPEQVLNHSDTSETDRNGDDIIGRDLIRKYVAFAKRSIHPQLTDEARKSLVDFYVNTRREGGEFSDSIAIGARSLEAMARLSEASARIRLSQEATLTDASRAIKITQAWRLGTLGETPDETDMNSGKKGTQRNQVRELKNLIQRMIKESPEDSVLTEDAITVAMSEMDLSHEKAKEIIDQEASKGNLFRPRHDRIGFA